MQLAKTLRNYDRKNLTKDLVTGLIIMAVSIPISMGYAQIAGLPAVYGLYGSVFPILLFALFSTSPQFIFGVDAAPAALVGAALVELGIESGSDQAMAVVPVLTFFVAVWLLLFALCKAGKLVNYISAPEAWNSFRDEYFNGSDAAAESFQGDNPLSKLSSYEVYVDQIENQDELISYVQGLSGVRVVNSSETATQTLSTFNKLLGYVSAAIIIILLAVSIFLISNTISVGISVRSNEIAIMKLIGATNFFVRAPFTIEGLLLGLVGSAIPLGLVYVLYGKTVSFVLTRFHILNDIVQFLDVKQVFAVLLPVGLVLGIGIGFVGSRFTIRKHLKV